MFERDPVAAEKLAAVDIGTVRMLASLNFLVIAQKG
jgi:hypothetical protein